MHAVVCVAVQVAAYAWRRAANYVPKKGKYPVGTLPAGAYDAVIVGAGPSGSVCGHYLAKKGIKVRHAAAALATRPAARHNISLELGLNIWPLAFAGSQPHACLSQHQTSMHACQAGT